jgi:hypothetical protein
VPTRQPQPGELLFEFYRERDHRRWCSELRQHPEPYGRTRNQTLVTTADTLVGLDPANGVAAPDDARLYHLSVDTGTGQLPKIAQVDAVALRDGPQDSWVMREIPLR